MGAEISRTTAEFLDAARDRTERVGAASVPVVHRIGARRLIIAGSLLIVAVITVARCGVYNLHAAPAGIADHLPGHNANAPAYQATGTCKLFGTDKIHAVLGGNVGSPTADNLTPGLDRCDWTVKDSRLTKTQIEITAYRSLNSNEPPIRGHRSTLDRGLVHVPTLGADATYSPLDHTLSYTNAGQKLSLQVIAPRRTTLDNHAVQAALTQLASNP